MHPIPYFSNFHASKNFLHPQPINAVLFSLYSVSGVRVVYSFPSLQLQIEFNKNLSQTLAEKKSELKKIKELHYEDITALKRKMNDAVSGCFVENKLSLNYENISDLIRKKRII